MKAVSTIAALVLAAGNAEAFSVATRSQRPVSFALSMGIFNSQKSPNRKQSGNWLDNLLNGPVHGSGSAGEKELDDMYEAQQKILQSRRENFGKDALRNKYKSGESHMHDIKAMDYSPSEKNKKEDNDMYVDEGFKMPWDKKKK